MSNKDSPAVSQLTAPSRSMAEAIEMIDRCQTFGTLWAVDHPAHRLGDRGPAHWGDRDTSRHLRRVSSRLLRAGALGGHLSLSNISGVAIPGGACHSEQGETL